MFFGDLPEKALSGNGGDWLEIMQFSQKNLWEIAINVEFTQEYIREHENAKR